MTSTIIMILTRIRYTLIRHLFISRDILRKTLLWLVFFGVRFSYLFNHKRKPFLWWSLRIILLRRFFTRNLFLFYITFELRLIPIILIILTNGNQPERVSASLYLTLYTITLSVPYLLIILILLPLRNEFFFRKNCLRRFNFSIIILLPFLVKIPIIGLHFWLPKAHVEANTRGSIVLAGLLLKLGRYGVTRIIFLITTTFYSFLRLWILLSLLSRIITLLQTDTKKLVAFRRITHITIIIVALLNKSQLVILRVIILSLAHGWRSIRIFALIGILARPLQSRLGYFLKSEMTLNWFILIRGIFLINNSSIPPIPSFFREVNIFFLLFSISKRSFLLILILRFFICYYNAFIFLWTTHAKPFLPSFSKLNLSERIIFIKITLTLVLSLIWLSLL